VKEQQTPKYMQLKQQILSWIVTGQFKPHDKLPSENEIGQQFGMSRQTVRQALGDLEQESWLYRVQGKGTFVSDQSAQGRRVASQGMTIGMITTHISDYIFPTIVRGVESSLRAVGEPGVDAARAADGANR
jgi:GntR family transcriptional regulator of arabinose operon